MRNVNSKGIYYPFKGFIQSKEIHDVNKELICYLRAKWLIWLCINLSLTNPNSNRNATKTVLNIVAVFNNLFFFGLFIIEGIFLSLTFNMV